MTDLTPEQIELVIRYGRCAICGAPLCVEATFTTDDDGNGTYARRLTCAAEPDAHYEL